MTQSVLLFVSSFFSIFLLGFQSQMVRDKHIKMAFVISIHLGLANLIFFKYVPGAGFWPCLFWVLGGGLGIVASIKAHDVWLKYFPNHKIKHKRLIHKERTRNGLLQHL